MKKLLILGAPFKLYQGGTEYQYGIIEDVLKGKYSSYYLFRHHLRYDNCKYFTYDYKIRRVYNKYLWSDSIRIYRIINQIKPDLIYKRGVNYIAAVGVIYAKLNNIKIFLHIASEEDLKKFCFKFRVSILFEYLHKYISKFCIIKSSHIICQARYQSKLLSKNFNRQCDVILANMHPLPTNCIKKFRPIKIVWIANFKRLKQPQLFIKLAEEFQYNSDVKFIMIGKSGNTKWDKILLNRISCVRNIEYLGKLPIDEVNRILSISHIFVNTSEYEGFPNTYIQAWMRKVPVVALKVDPDGYIKKYKIGFLSNSFEQMIIDVNSLIENDELRNEMGNKSMIIAHKNFTVSNIWKLINLFA